MIIDESHEIFGNAITIFLQKYGDDLDYLFSKEKIYRNVREFIAFAEYVGENSFAGYHDPNDKMKIILFDINVYKKGLIPPKEFLDYFGHLHIPELIYQGNLNQSFIQEVRNNKFNLKEGVVYKWVRKTKGNDIVWMAKIKTIEWLNRLKNKFGEETLNKELSEKDII